MEAFGRTGESLLNCNPMLTTSRNEKRVTTGIETLTANAQVQKGGDGELPRLCSREEKLQSPKAMFDRLWTGGVEPTCQQHLYPPHRLTGEKKERKSMALTNKNVCKREGDLKHIKGLRRKRYS